MWLPCGRTESKRQSEQCDARTPGALTGLLLGVDSQPSIIKQSRP